MSTPQNNSRGCDRMLLKMFRTQLWHMEQMANFNSVWIQDFSIGFTPLDPRWGYGKDLE